MIKLSPFSSIIIKINQNSSIGGGPLGVCVAL